MVICIIVYERAVSRGRLGCHTRARHGRHPPRAGPLCAGLFSLRMHSIDSQDVSWIQSDAIGYDIGGMATTMLEKVHEAA